MNIYLVGFMGAGKTTVGQYLADLLGWDFVDLDHVIAISETRSIQDIFQEKGEPYFRVREKQELLRVSSGNHQVIALGGGAFCNEENIALVNNAGLTVWLDVSLAAILSRCQQDGSRPLFTTESQMEELLATRRPSYARAALHLVVDGLQVHEIAEKIQQAMIHSSEQKNFNIQ